MGGDQLRHADEFGQHQLSLESTTCDDDDDQVWEFLNHNGSLTGKIDKCKI